MIPKGAERIVKARMGGKKPADTVLISLVGLLDELNPQVVVENTSKYEWWWVRGLKVIVYVDNTVDWKRALRDIAPHKPSYLGVWDYMRRQGAQVFFLPTSDSIDKPQDKWKWELSFLAWLPFQNQEYQNAAH